MYSAMLRLFRSLFSLRVLCVSQSVAGALSGVAKMAGSGCGLLAKDAFIPAWFA